VRAGQLRHVLDRAEQRDARVLQQRDEPEGIEVGDVLRCHDQDHAGEGDGTEELLLQVGRARRNAAG
jgi:hypothetical protein